MRVKIILSLIFLFGLTIRLVGLDVNPPGLNWDEVSQGYNTYSVLKTGSDEWGEIPLTNFRAYGDYPTTFYLYTLVPVVATLGLNEFSVRLPSAIFGSLLILVMFGLTKQIFKKDSLALLSAALIAISPWSLMLSRQAIQVIPAIFLVGLGLYLWLKGISGNKWWLVGSSFCLGLSTFSYHNTRILAPIILIVLIIFYCKVLLKHLKILSMVLLVSIIFFVPSFLAITSEGSARATWVGILDQGAINRINESRNSSELPGPLPKLTNNKVTYFIETSLTNYVGYFNPLFLGVEGGTHYQFSIPGFGVIYPIELIFFYIGLVLLLIKFLKIETEKKLILILLLLTPVPAAITRDPYQVVRSAVAMIPVNLTIILGFEYFCKLLKTRESIKLASGIFAIVLLVFFLRYTQTYWNDYPKQFSFAWQYGYEEVANYLTAHPEYSKVYITKKYGEPHEFLLFYTKYDPVKYKSDPNLNRYKRTDWYWVDSFDRYVFLNDWEVKEKAICQKNEKCLLVTSEGNSPGGQVIKTINFLDGKRAFDIVELQYVQ